jgi:hypothetical protein
MGVSTLHLYSKSLTADLEIAYPLIARPIGNVKSASIQRSNWFGCQLSISAQWAFPGSRPPLYYLI